MNELSCLGLEKGYGFGETRAPENQFGPGGPFRALGLRRRDLPIRVVSPSSSNKTKRPDGGKHVHRCPQRAVSPQHVKLFFRFDPRERCTTTLYRIRVTKRMGERHALSPLQLVAVLLIW